MKTDVKEKDNAYEVAIDLPGFKKDEIQIQLENGYVTVSAAKGLDKDEKDKEGKYIRRERYTGNVSRSFYVGNNVQREDIHPKFEWYSFLYCSKRAEGSRKQLTLYFHRRLISNGQGIKPLPVLKAKCNRKRGF